MSYASFSLIFCTQRHGDTEVFFHSCWPNHPHPLLQKEGSLEGSLRARGRVGPLLLKEGEGVVKQAVLRARGG